MGNKDKNIKEILCCVLCFFFVAIMFGQHIVFIRFLKS